MSRFTSSGPRCVSTSLHLGSQLRSCGESERGISSSGDVKTTRPHKKEVARQVERQSSIFEFLEEGLEDGVAIKSFQPQLSLVEAFSASRFFWILIINSSTHVMHDQCKNANESR